MTDMKVYVVNAFPDRRLMLEPQLDARGIRNVEWVASPTGRDWRKYEVRPSCLWRDDHNPKLITNGEMGSGTGQMLIADLIAESGEPGILLEDDAKLLDDLPTLEEFRRAKCDILYLGGKPVGDNIVAPQSPWYEPDILWWTIGYVMTPEAAQKLSEYRAAEPLIPADEILPGFYCGKYTSTLPPYVPFPSYRLHAKAVHPWRVEPNNWPSKTDNDDYAFDLRVALFATDPKKAEHTLGSYRDLGYEVDVLGHGKKPWDTKKQGGFQKLEWLRGYLETQDWNTVVLATDGYDVEPQIGPHELLKRFGRLRHPLIVSGEINCWPHKRLADDLKSLPPYTAETNAVYPYPCTGLMMGHAPIFRDAIDEAIRRYPNEIGDQAPIQELILHDQRMGEDRWRIDRGAYIFRNMHHAEPLLDDGTDGRTGHKPAILHWNGPMQLPWEEKSIGAAELKSNIEEHFAVKKTRLNRCPYLWGRMFDGALAIDGGFWIVPAMYREDVEKLVSALKTISMGDWQPLAGDDVPGDEYRGDYLSPLEDLVQDEILPILRSLIVPASVSEVSDIFAIRHGGRQRSLSLHNDISHISGSIKLQSADEGGELYFPIQNWSDRLLPVGASVWWPSALSHPHTTTPVVDGERLSVTVWTKR